MFEEYSICPYTGLRSFTEEESLYFKGREEHIEHATEQLQRNKFLMLTGASGDGKSSLVYAGIIPNARAGFLKSKYTQWCVADFRPERNPFKNLCRVIARQLGISNPSTVESELQHGFSALTDLYRNSKRFVDTDSIAWNQADEKGRAALKREAANLVILVDQFEEFFTNPENYHQGVPSPDSNLVLNLLLETARIALEEDLPLYIVFTMRSDFIGQCAAFRSLPEYIGFSQFFVPRLNRSQLQQVIEEPALLSGNRISRRLTERLIHDVADGVDQLPILQHALNQVWHAASNGKDEMDLIHYAMVGGMPSAELPDDQVDQFTKWFDALPKNIQPYYREPNLQNVLDTHANKLFESAGQRVRNEIGKELSAEVVKAIIKTTFTCLTKIDQSRAVRNRMSLGEIHHILNRTEITLPEMAHVLQIFREAGNTFVRPFINEDPESLELTEDSVLDITHESLIRNWELLGAWAREEFDNYAISLDFEKQLNRWVESGKSGDFLLSMGPLTYFETWFRKANPNVWWIARYLPVDEEQERKVERAKGILQNATDFLKRSARKHLITRSIIKYGPARIAAVLAVMGLVVLSSFGVNSYLERLNSFVLDQIKHESLALAGNPKVALSDKAILLCENVKLGLTTIPEIAHGIDDPVERVNAIAGMATALIIHGWHEPEKEIYQALTVADSLLELFPVSLSTPRYQEIFKETNELMVTLDFGYYLNPTEKMNRLVKRNAVRTAGWLQLIARNKPSAFADIKNFDVGIEHAVNHQVLQQEALTELLLLLSPFEQAKLDPWVKAKFARDMTSERGRANYALAFNGLYQELAYLYAAAGNSVKALMCVDTLIKYNQRYHDNNYANMPDHGAHLSATFYQYQHYASMDGFVSGYCERRKITETEFYRMAVAHNRIETNGVWRLNYYPFFNRVTNLNMLLADTNQQAFFFRKYKQALKKSNADEQNFYTALIFKDQAINLSMALKHKGINDEPPKINAWFDSSFYYYRKVSKEFLEKKVMLFDNSTERPRKFLFLYPDFMSAYMPYEPRLGYNYYSSMRFLEYVLSHQLFDEMFTTASEMTYIEEWLFEYHLVQWLKNLMLREPMNAKLLAQLERHVSRSKTGQQININDVRLLLGHEMAMKNQVDSAQYYYHRVDLKKVPSGLFNFQDGNSPGMMRIGLAVSDLTSMDAFDDAFLFIQTLKKPVNRSSLYGFAAKEMLMRKVKSSYIDRLIDSARIEMLRVQNTGVDQQSRFHLPYALAMRAGDRDIEEANRTIRNVSSKFNIQAAISRSMAFGGNLYESLENIPPTVSATDKTVFLWNILYGYSGMENQWGSWKEYVANYPPWYTRKIHYDDEND